MVVSSATILPEEISSSAAVPLTIAGLTKPPNADLLSWQETLSAKEQRGHIKVGHRVKIRRAFPKRGGRAGNNPLVNEWQGGIITKVLHDIGCVCIQYNDNTTHLVWSFPHKLIVVDDDENGNHQVTAEFFAPPSYSQFYRNSSEGSNDSTSGLAQGDSSGGRPMRSRRGARRNYLDLLNPDLQEGKENRLSSQNWEKSAGKTVRKRCPPKSVFKSKKEVNLIAASIQKMAQESILKNGNDEAQQVLETNAEVVKEKKVPNQKPTRTATKQDREKGLSNVKVKPLRIRINKSSLRAVRLTSKSKNLRAATAALKSKKDAIVVTPDSKKVTTQTTKPKNDTVRTTSQQQARVPRREQPKRRSALTKRPLPTRSTLRSTLKSKEVKDAGDRSGKIAKPILVKKEPETPTIATAHQVLIKTRKKEEKRTVSKKMKKSTKAVIPVKKFSTRLNFRSKRGTETTAHASTIEQDAKTAHITTSQQSVKLESGQDKKKKSISSQKRPSRQKGSKKSPRIASKRLAAKFTPKPKRERKLIVAKIEKTLKKATLKNNAKNSTVSKKRAKAATPLNQKPPNEVAATKSAKRKTVATPTRIPTTVIPSVYNSSGRRSRAFGSQHEVRLFAMAFQRTFVMS